MTYLQLNKSDRWIIKDWMNTRFWLLIKALLEERKEELKAGIISWINPEMSKTNYSKRDLLLKELEDIDEFLITPELLLTRISNSTDISAEGETA